jgi:hypothetical protein
MRAPVPTAVVRHDRQPPSPPEQAVAVRPVRAPAPGQMVGQGRTRGVAAVASTTGTTVGAAVVLPRRDGSEFSGR